MKKILLMLAMLLPCMGAWADVAPLKVSTDAQKYYYVIKNFRSNKFACYNGDATRLKQNGNPSSETAEADLNKYLWYITAATGEDAYMLHNIATQNICAGNESFTGSGATIYIKENPHNAGYFCISTNSDLTQNCWDDSNGNNVGTWAPAANDFGGTSWNFIEIEDQEATVAYTLTDNAGNSFNSTFTGWSREMYPVVTGVAGYTLSNIAYGDRNVTATVNFPFPVSKVDGTTNWTYITSKPVSGATPYFYVKENGQVMYKTNQNSEYAYLPSANNVNQYLWAIYPTLTEGKFTFKVKNSYSEKYLPGTNSVQQVTSVFVTEDGGDYCWGTCIGANGFFLEDYENLFFSAPGSGTGEKASWLWSKSGTSHQGGNLLFVAPLYKANCVLTDNSGNEYSWLTTINYTSDESDVERPNVTGIPSTLISNIQWNEGVCSADVNFYFVASTPSKDNPTMISTYNYSGIKDSHKWYASDNKVKVEKEDEKIAKGNIVTASNIATHLWMIYPNFDNGVFTFKIKNLATGLFINSSANSSQHDATSTVTLSEEASNFTLGHRDGSAIEFINNANYRLSVNSSGANKGEQTVGTHTSHYGSAVTFPTVSYKVNVSEVGFATLYSPIAGAFDGDVKTYAIESASNNSATLIEKTGVAANQGAIIEATPGTYTFTAGEVSSDWNSNLLTGSSVNTLVNESAYVLARVEGVAVLALADLNKNEAGATGTTHFLNNAGKAYLPASAVVAGARTLFFGGNTTDIEDSTLAPVFNANAPIYDLSGRRVMNAVKGGIYIQNGKKFIVK